MRAGHETAPSAPFAADSAALLAGEGRERQQALREQETRELLKMLGEVGVWPVVRRYAPSENIPPEHGNALCILREGAIKAFRHLPRGKVDLRLFGPWDLFGRLTTAGDRLLPDSMIAATSSEVAKVPALFLERAIRARPEIQIRLSTIQELRLLDREELATRLMARSTQARLADLLLWLTDRFGEDDGTIGLRLTHEELGAMIGCTRESTNESLNRLRRRELVDISRGLVIIRNFDALEQLKQR